MEENNLFERLFLIQTKNLFEIKNTRVEITPLGPKLKMGASRSLVGLLLLTKFYSRIGQRLVGVLFRQNF